MAFPGEDLELQIIEISGEPGETLAYLKITNRASVSLDDHWRLYFSLGLNPVATEHRVKRVIVDGRYGYLEPDDWTPLLPDSSIEIPIENWLLNRIPVRARQGFHFTESDARRNPVIPTILPPVLLPLDSLQNSLIRELSPTCDVEPQTPEHVWLINQRSQQEVTNPTIVPRVKTFDTSGSFFDCPGFNFEHEGLQPMLQSTTRGLPVLVTVNPEFIKDRYTLRVNDQQIEISAGSNRAVFYAGHTLRQLLAEDGSMPVCQIDDYPDFDHRGLFVDIARHFQSIHDIKRVIEAMATYKMNRLQLGISNDEGWRLEIPGLPELTEIGARRTFHATDEDGSPRGLYPAWGDGPEEQHEYLTTAEFTDLLVFAAAHHIEVVIELNLPAHANALIRAMSGSDDFMIVDPLDESVHRSAQGYANNVVNVCMPDTYELSAKILTAIQDCYKIAGVPFSRIHLGGDEVPDGAWLHSPVCRKSESWNPSWDVSSKEDRRAVESTLLRGYAEKILAIIKQLSPTTQVGFWHEMSPALPASDNIYVTGWTTEAVDRELITAVLDREQSLVIANASFLYLDMPYGLHAEEPGLPWAAYIDSQRIYDFDPLTCWQIPVGKRSQVKGIQAQLWSETVTNPQLMDYYLFPRLLAVAERAWSQEPDADAWAGFARALADRELSHLDSLGMNYRLPPPGARFLNGGLIANVIFPGLVIRYTTDGTDPTPDATAYMGPIDTADITEIRLATFSNIGNRSSRIVSVVTRSL